MITKMGREAVAQVEGRPGPGPGAKVPSTVSTGGAAALFSRGSGGRPGGASVWPEPQPGHRLWCPPAAGRLRPHAVRSGGLAASRASRLAARECPAPRLRLRFHSAQSGPEGARGEPPRVRVHRGVLMATGKNRALFAFVLLLCFPVS